MKTSFCLVALCATAVAGFAPQHHMAKTMVDPLNMVSNALPPGPDPTRVVAVPPVYSEASKSYIARKGEIMVDPDYRWSKALAAMGPAMLMMYPSAIGVGASAFHLILAAFLASQTNRVRLVFGKDSFELFNLSNSGTYLKEKPSNYVAGTLNRWKYKDVVDYGFFPSVHNPFIVYFKETATSDDQWGKFGWWGMVASNIYMGNKKIAGQPHFMPALFDTEELIAQMKARGVKSSSMDL